jgi:D-glycero-D-manno-heptose 1,7-bisphosphate phosphatase
MSRGGIFLDRDGTINDEVDFLRTPDQLRLLEGSAQAIRELNEGGWPVFVITNQSGIARGLLTERDLALVHTKLLADLKAHGASIDAIYYCPHHADYGEPPYRQDCDCRKPKTGMLDRAAKEFQIDLKQSFVVGDRMFDIQAGNAVGARSILVLTGYGNEELELCRRNGVPINHIARNLAEAVRHIQQTTLITR